MSSRSPFFDFFDAINDEVASFNNKFAVETRPRAPGLKSGKVEKYAPPTWRSVPAVIPPVDVLEKEKSYEVHLSVPGIEDQNSINIEYHEDKAEILISGEIPTRETEENKNGWRVRERSSGNFRRLIGLPEKPGIDADRITAEYKNGVLTLIAPKLEPREGDNVRKIKINKL